jgi:hypothetical protein
MNSALKKDIHNFLNTYYNFKITVNEKCVILSGIITVFDINNVPWGNYDIDVFVPTINYPQVTPIVVETTKNIERSWDFHISDEGICCLSIPHKLILAKRSGINLINFYRDFIYPFFANHQFKLKTGKYANGEFAHLEKGILQFYKEELETDNLLFIEKVIKTGLGKLKIGNNDKCTICGDKKFKKCCKPKVLAIEKYGIKQLEKDLNIISNEILKYKSL